MNKDPHPELPSKFWSKDVRLSWDDFKGKPDSEINAAARSAVGFECHPSVEYMKTESKIKFKIRSFGIRAIFIPDLSWRDPNNITEAGSSSVLKHEQGHFDLAEEIARKSNTRLDAEFNERTFSIKGKNEDESRKNAQKIINEFVSKQINEAHDELGMLEKKYDDETKHGMIKEKQDTYNERFNRLRL